MRQARGFVTLDKALVSSLFKVWDRPRERGILLKEGLIYARLLGSGASAVLAILCNHQEVHQFVFVKLHVVL